METLNKLDRPFRGLFPQYINNQVCFVFDLVWFVCFVLFVWFGLFSLFVLFVCFLCLLACWFIGLICLICFVSNHLFDFQCELRFTKQKKNKQTNKKKLTECKI